MEWFFNARRIGVLRVITVGAAAVTAFALGLPAGATAPPVGPLPNGAETTIRTQAGSLVAVALPHQSGGSVWRLANAVTTKLLVEVSEADVGQHVVVVYRAARPGRARLAYGLTRGESRRALASLTFDVIVTSR